MRVSHRLTSTGTVLGAALLTAGLLGGSSAASPLPDPVPGPTTAAPAGAAGRAAANRVVVVATGDIACPPRAKTTPTRCQQAKTADLAASLHPDVVLALGDLQYESGVLSAFRNSYDKTWGALLNRTRPVPGNHEYKTAGASGYYTYFDGRQPGAPGYYAFDLADWRVYALNSNCDKIDCAKEYDWLRDDLAANARACSLFTMHHPRFSSGLEHGSNESMKTFFRIAVKNDVEMVLAGHDHDYERFKRMRSGGKVDKGGVLSFVAGAGGKSLYHIGKVVEGSAYRQAARFGVLRLALRPAKFRFAFKAVDGTTPDKGTRSCR